MNSEVQILPLSCQGKDLKRFLRAGGIAYGDDPLWVAPLWADTCKLLSHRNPFFDHAEMSLWIASRDERDVGRIAAIIDRLCSESPSDLTAYFGFFELINDRTVGHALFETVVAWARSRGARRLLGPMNPSANHECGLLVDGFDRSPVLMMSYNPSYYQDLIVAEGFSKAKDLQAFYIDLAKCPFDRLERVSSRFRSREPELRIRPIRRRTLRLDLPKLEEVYNQAWSANWEFVPMTSAEVHFMAERLSPLLTEGLAWIAESPAEPVGFVLALPDFNEAIKPLRGRFLTPKLVGLLPYLLGRKRPAMARVIALGVKARFRRRGIEVAMLTEGLKVGRQIGLRAAEASWVFEDNLITRQTIEVFGGKPYKTYRLYQRSLD